MLQKLKKKKYQPASTHTIVCADTEHEKRIAQNSRLLREDLPWLHALRPKWYLWVVTFKVIDVKKGKHNEQFEQAMHRPVESIKEIWLVKETESQIESYSVALGDPQQTVASAIAQHDQFRVNDPINFIVVIDKDQTDCREFIRIFRGPRVVHPNAEWHLDDRISTIISSTRTVH